jgi:hypothetical protein
VQSNSSNEVLVNVRCETCTHQWQLARETPALAPRREMQLPDDASE